MTDRNSVLEEAAKEAAWCHMNYVPSADIARRIRALKQAQPEATKERSTALAALKGSK